MPWCNLTARETLRNNKLGVYPLTWPAQGRALLPESLRGAWAGEPLPVWLIRRAGLPPSCTLDALGPELSIEADEALERYLVRLLHARQRPLAHLPVLTTRWPRDLTTERIDWRIRTWNCLRRVGLLRDLQRLSRVTYGDLFAIPSMGAKSVLDFAVNAEVAIHQRFGPNEGTHDANSLVDVIGFPWADMVSEEDPRFTDLFPPGKGTLLERIDALTAVSALAFDDRHVAQLVKSLPAVTARVETLGNLPLDVALLQYVSALSETSGSRLDALLARLGWGDTPALTLQEAAARIGVTRERLRQLQERMTEHVPSHPVFMPALDNALAFLAANAPLHAHEVGPRLVASGISALPFHPANVLWAASLCKRTATFQLQEIKGQTCVVTNTALASSHRVLTIAARRACAAGATNVEDVVAAATQEGIDITATEVRDLLLPLAGAVFLEEEWFWIPPIRPERNRLYNVARAILSVVCPVDVTTIRDGARRKYRFREAGVVPPRSVMLAFFEAHPDFRVDQSGLVATLEPLDYRQELGTAEQIVVDVLRSSATGILDRDTLTRGCQARGLNPHTLGVMTSYSPVLEHLGTDVWALRGTRVDPATLAAFREANALQPRQRRIVDHGWSRDGRLWLAIRVPHAPAGRVFGVPSAVVRYLTGRRFAAYTEERSPAGTLVVDERGSCWGYGPFLNRAGADEDDILVITFDLATDEAVLAVASNETFEEIAG